MKKLFIAFCLLLFAFSSNAQSFYNHSKAADKWVKKQFRKLSKKERIAQLIIIRAHSNLGQDHITSVTNLINQYNVGGLCFFQGGPVRQAMLTNYYQSITKTPLMVCIDGEWGLGMRLDSVINFPRQLMMGAVGNAQLIYQFGKAVGEQCKRVGVQVNYAPDIDVNNNPDNPVINDRSFGEDKYKVALYGTEYMRGMQEVNIMACAKHFPGHGDVAVDSHKDLPVIKKTREQLDNLELYPFKELIKAGVGSMMIAHLYIPAIDTTANQATSLSQKNVTGLLKEELGFKGITFTDGLGMQGITKFYPSGEASVQALIAGNDMLCLPEDVAGSIEKVLQAIKDRKLNWDDINARVKKVLLAKYNLGLNNFKPIETENIVADLNLQTKKINELLAKNAITLLRNSNTSLLPLKANKVAYISIGSPKENVIAARLRKENNADVYLFGSKAAVGKEVMDDLSKMNVVDKTDSAAVTQLVQTLQQKNYDAVIVGVHNYSRRPANNYGINKPTVYLLNELNKFNQSAFLFFGNPYAIKNLCDAKNLFACYEDDDITQNTSADILQGKSQPKGKLSVTVCNDLKFGDGIAYNSYFPSATPQSIHVNTEKLQAIDSIANDAVAKGAFPGCVVLAAKDGKIIYHKAFGNTSTTSNQPVSINTVYDLASVTKVSATTVSIMKLYEEGKISLDKTLGDYLPWTKGTDKALLTLRNILLHQAGLNPFIPFYREVIDTASGEPKWTVFSTVQDAQHQYRAAENLYVRNDWEDTLYKRILQSKLTAPNKYVYSDNDFIFLGKIVEAVSGKPLNEYARENFYEPLNMLTTGFHPRERMPLEDIAPTELEKHFRRQLIWGDVHDEGSAMFGGVAGHAGLFSNAYDLAQLYQMLLNGGELNGKRFFKKETVDLFTAYNSDVSRRGLGFDKPEKDNATNKSPYPSKLASLQTFGHTGFTGTCVWVDPKYNIVYIFLSNRVNPTRDNNKLSSLGVRGKIQDVIISAVSN
ncbi:MAG: serine hydrolase [Chitinophaga sp.]|jgi:beta-N-acetylhexosaminidase|nr:serine hydrolase [Chitinophaga sp.]